MTSPTLSQELGSLPAYVTDSQNSQPLELLRSDTMRDIFDSLSRDQKYVIRPSSSDSSSQICGDE